ncbi:MAG: RagB/SusD family nutrient uptake outer membrane protein [Cyclobacteriaceae bacterium]|uniref:RagB/SusD family nutrient uptake outer membrane protein n=1 Tax=Reichenbachiella sp. TaxID=2184521 RepID=UPI003263A93B
MKLKILFSATFLVLMTLSCDIEEDPKIFAGDTMFQDVAGAQTVLNSVYAYVGNFKSMSGIFPQLVTGCSGLFGMGNNGLATVIGNLSPYSSHNFITRQWTGFYITVGRANDLIDGLSEVKLENVEEQNDILGQAYFIRSWMYFNMARMWGGVPLVVGRVTPDNANLPKASIEEVYEQVIDDALEAKALLKDISNQSTGRPASQAASMLLAKVYMELAGNQTASETNYWQMAKDEALEVYGNYTLVSDLSTLWYPETSDNSEESIFELQGNETYTYQWEQLYSANGSNLGRNMAGKMFVNLEVYDSHVNRYPDDPRIATTFVTSFLRYKSNSINDTVTVNTYPYSSKRGDLRESFPFCFKYFVKDHTKTSYFTNQNLVVYRYADLLLMLAEIENELNGPTDAYQYVNEVLARARTSGGASATEPADWSGLTQEEFREAIMQEHTYELLGEGHDWFNVRRRGYDWFKTHVIDVHNSHPTYDFSTRYDHEYQDNPRIMLLPLPSTEIAANPNVSDADQNYGY